MSSEFIALRALARAKRDKAINFAKSEYEADLKQIAILEQDLLGKESTRHQKISVCIEQVIPSDRTFTTVDILTGLEALDPTRAWRPNSIHNHLSVLRKRGLVRRVKKSSGTEPCVYVRAGVESESIPFADRTLTDVVKATLTRPMTQTELVVVLLEAGYQTSMKPDYLRNQVGRVLRKGGFKKEGDKWERIEGWE